MINVTHISVEDKLTLASFPVQYTPSPEFVYNLNVVYKDNANLERIPDGTEISLYWENTSGVIYYIDTYYIDNNDRFYNLKTTTNIYDEGDIKRFHFYLESDLENRPIRVPSAGSNPGVPGGGVVSLSVVLVMAGLSLEYLPMFFAVDYFYSLTRVVNVMGNVYSSIYVGVKSDEFDRDIFNASLSSKVD